MKDWIFQIGRLAFASSASYAQQWSAAGVGFTVITIGGDQGTHKTSSEWWERIFWRFFWRCEVTT